METAHRCGADFVKVFPMAAGGIGFIEAVRAPLPHLRLFPTAGVTVDNFIGYLEAGCAGVGFVRALFAPEDLARGDFDAIRDRAASITARLAAWRRSP
jgi:2-dehydro-3-deoxyphosphogluconate aldolase/(4S)-4-hydroxy-2-oxoglutarate aldolase